LDFYSAKHSTEKQSKDRLLTRVYIVHSFISYYLIRDSFGIVYGV